MKIDDVSVFTLLSTGLPYAIRRLSITLSLKS